MKIYFTVCLFVCFNGIISGQSFIPYSYNPVVDTINTMNSVLFWTRWKSDPCVIHWHNDSLRMYYGTNNYGEKTQIGTAVSADGNKWIEKSDAPVVPLGSMGSWDDKDVETPFVIYVPSNPDSAKYMLWYSGATKDTNLLDTICGVYESKIYQIGMAYSDDGLKWKKYNNPANNNIKLYAESDPVISIPYSGGCLPSSIGYESFAIAEPCVIYDSIKQKYKIWYIGLGCSNSKCNGSGDYRHRVLYSESDNGIQWSPGIPVLDIGNDSDFDSKIVYSPDVIKIENEYWMFYSGEDRGFSVMGPFALWHQRIGLAKSDNGIVFVKSKFNPVIKNGPTGSWNELGVNFSSSIVYHNTLRTYYSGARDTVYGFLPKIGYSYMDSVFLKIEILSKTNYDIFLYPNPTREKLTIKLNYKPTSSYRITLFDLNGKVILNKNSLLNTEVEISTEKLPAGVYHLVIYNENNVISKKVLLE